MIHDIWILFNYKKHDLMFVYLIAHPLKFKISIPLALIVIKIILDIVLQILIYI